MISDLSSWPDWAKMLVALGVVLPPFVGAGIGLWVKSLSGQARRLGALTTLGSVVSLFFSLLLLGVISGDSPHIQFGLFYLDALSVYFILLVNLVALFASLYTIYFFDTDSQNDEQKSPVEIPNWFHRRIRLIDTFLTTPRGFHVLFNLFHTSMLMVPMMDNLMLLWMFVAFTTVVSAPLVGYRQDQRSEEAALKYILISSAGVLFALLGTIFLISAFPENPNINWSALQHKARSLGQADRLTPGLVSKLSFVKLSFLFIWLGYGTKAGFFPMHTWIPDGHGQAPSPVSALLSGVLLKSALYAILRFYVITNLALTPAGAAPDHFASNILLISGLSSLVMATPFIVKRNRFKRVLAYHSLEHMGIITFGFGLGGSLALFGALLHSLNHALTKALMFLSYGNIRRAHANAGVKEEDIHGVFQSMPFTGYVLALGGLALVGSPPFNIFLSEFIILWAAVQTSAGNPLRIVAICLFLVSVTLIFGGLVAHLARIVLGKSPSDKIQEHTNRIIPLAILLLFILFGGFTTFPLTTLLNQSVAILCQGLCP